MFIGFTNFYQRFIRGFTRITVLLTSILKIIRSSKELASKTFKINNNEVVGGGNDRANETIKNSFRNLTHVLNIEATEELNFLTPNIKKAFNYLRLAFIKAPILRHFDLKSYIWIEPDALSYAIGRVLSQLNLNLDASPNNSNKSDFSQWHLIAYFSRKMISIETQYKTHDAEFLAIVEAFKTWRHYLEGYKHKIFALTGHNNFHWFMDIKSLSFC